MRRCSCTLAMLVAVVPLLRCTSFGESGTDTPTSPLDAATDGAMDSGPADDAQAQPADSGRPCKVSMLRDHFERATLTPPAPWDSMSIEKAGTLTLADGDTTHAGTFLQIEIPAANMGGSYLEKALGNVSRVRYRYALRVAKTPGRAISISTIEQANASLCIAVDAVGKLLLFEQALGATMHGTGHDLGPSDGAWHTYEISLELANPPTASVAIDGKTPLNVKLAEPFAVGPTSVRAGVAFTTPGAMTTVIATDDVDVCAD